VTSINPALQGLDPSVVYREIPHDAVLARLRFNYGHGPRAERPKHQAKGNPQNHRQNHAELVSPVVCTVPIHDALLSNRDQGLPNISFVFLTFLPPYGATSFSAGRVARSAAPVGLPLAISKRGGACLLAHGMSSSDAVRATHRGIDRRSREAALL